MLLHSLLDGAAASAEAEADPPGGGAAPEASIGGEGVDRDRCVWACLRLLSVNP